MALRHSSPTSLDKTKTVLLKSFRFGSVQMTAEEPHQARAVAVEPAGSGWEQRPWVPLRHEQVCSPSLGETVHFSCALAMYSIVSEVLKMYGCVCVCVCAHMLLEVKPGNQGLDLSSEMSLLSSCLHIH
jgi:hypothetical protein